MTPPWCLLSVLTALRGLVQLSATEWRWSVQGAKERTYPELVGRGARARLVVHAGEVGGRWSGDTSNFLRLLAEPKARPEPPILRRRVECAWQARWGAILSCAAAWALACSLLNPRRACYRW